MLCQPTVPKQTASRRLSAALAAPYALFRRLSLQRKEVRGVNADAAQMLAELAEQLCRAAPGDVDAVAAVLSCADVQALRRMLVATYEKLPRRVLLEKKFLEEPEQEGPADASPPLLPVSMPIAPGSVHEAGCSSWASVSTHLPGSAHEGGSGTRGTSSFVVASQAWQPLTFSEACSRCGQPCPCRSRADCGGRATDLEQLHHTEDPPEMCGAAQGKFAHSTWQHDKGSAEVLEEVLEEVSWQDDSETNVPSPSESSHSRKRLCFALRQRAREAEDPQPGAAANAAGIQWYKDGLPIVPSGMRSSSSTSVLSKDPRLCDPRLTSQSSSLCSDTTSMLIEKAWKDAAGGGSKPGSGASGHSLILRDQDVATPPPSQSQRQQGSQGHLAERMDAWRVRRDQRAARQAQQRRDNRMSYGMMLRQQREHMGPIH
mmetsp:Transcript_49506/g.117838  ORF Transcript_49506/g.117838 Transcript_49506/m.117838 type:complete len:430 (-) Transcript_49506:127-1416(-)